MLILRHTFCLECSEVKGCDTPIFQGQRESRDMSVFVIPKELGQSYRKWHFLCLRDHYFGDNSALFLLLLLLRLAAHMFRF